MNILYITAQPILINSSANIRNMALIKGLIELGHHVDILNMAVTEKAAGYDNSLLKILDGVSIHYIEPIKIHNDMVIKKEADKSFMRTVKDFARYLYRIFSIYDSLALSIKNVKNIEGPNEKYDVIISSSDLKSSHLIAREYIQRFPEKCGTWIQYWGDPLTIDINNSSKCPTWLIKKAEEKLLRLADKIVYVSPFTLKAQQTIFPKLASKMQFVPIAYIEPKVSDNKHIVKTPIKLGYFGDYMSMTRDIMPLYEAAKKMNIRLWIVGNSDIKLENSNNINVELRTSYNEIQELMEECDVLVCICNRKGTQIPGKIYHYAAFDKPILIIENKEFSIGEYLDKYDKQGKYIYCNNDINSISVAISELTKHWPEKGSAPLAAFSSKEIAHTFLDGIGGV